MTYFEEQQLLSVMVYALSLWYTYPQGDILEKMGSSYIAAENATATEKLQNKQNTCTGE